MSFALFVIIFSVVWTAVNLYVVGRPLKALGVPRRWARVIRVVVLLLAFSYVLGRLWQRAGAPEVPGHALVLAGVWWIGVVCVTLTVFLMVEPVRALVLALRGRPRRIRALWRLVLSPWSRPLVLATLALCLAVVVHAALAGHALPRVTRLEVVAPPGKTLSRAVKIVLVSDLHMGRLVGREDVAAVVDLVNGLEPDLVVLTGDLVDESSSYVDEALPELGRLRARLGTFAVTGNHEIHSHLGSFVPRMEGLGIKVLRQSRVRLDGRGITLAGVDDPRALAARGGPEPEAALDEATRGAPVGDFLVLLSHRPLLAERAAARGVNLMLSGHTHGGQLPPFQLVVKMVNDGFLAGSYRVARDCTLYVSSGAGTWGPRMRLFSHSEIVEIKVLPGP